MREHLIQFYKQYKTRKDKRVEARLKKQYLENGQIPWSQGYTFYKEEQITLCIHNVDILSTFKNNEQLPSNYGYRLDERIVEYAWLFSRLPQGSLRLLDAGSTFNFEFIVQHPTIEEKELSILTYAPEPNCFYKKRISYLFADLRDIPFREYYFDTIVSQSTIEHIDMDNRLYGYGTGVSNTNPQKSYEYLIAIREMLRILKAGGTLLLTFPFGKFENHGFFQQFDDEMLEKLLDEMKNLGTSQCSFFRYLPEGWTRCQQADCRDVISYNPHTGKGKGSDQAAHCRSICCIEFSKAP